MLYELLAIARTRVSIANRNVHEDAKAVASTVGKLIIENRGVVRRIVAIGPKHLPKFMKKGQEKHFQGNYFTMLFDVSPSAQNELSRILKNDPRVIRSVIYKVDTSKKLNAKISIDAANEAVSQL